MNNFLDKLSNYSAITITTLTTFLVLLSSAPTVYLLTTIFDIEYTPFIIGASIGVPLLLAPPVIYTLLKLSIHLKYFQEELEKLVNNKNG